MDVTYSLPTNLTQRANVKYIRVVLHWFSDPYHYYAYFQPVRIVRVEESGQLVSAPWWNGPNYLMYGDVPAGNNPYPGGAGVTTYFNTHGHTSASDGTCTPATMRRKYWADLNRLDPTPSDPSLPKFGIITDHKIVTLFTPRQDDATKNVVVLKEGAHLYGGFAGTETQRDQRNPSANPTIVHGQDSRRCVLVDASSDWTDPSNVSIDGFTIKNGNVVNGNGGGLCNIASGITVQNCTFTLNQAAYGAGMYNGSAFGTDGNPISAPAVSVSNCTFTNNTAFTADNAAGDALTYSAGGGMFNDYSRTVNVTECAFEANTAPTGAGRGGGMCCDFSTGTVAGSAFTANRCGWEDEERWIVYCGYTSGAGLSNRCSALTVQDCTFTENKAKGRGSRGGALTVDCTESPQVATTVSGNVFEDNEVLYPGDCGGAMYCANTIASIVNNTITHNSPTSIGGGIWCYGGSPAIVNNVIGYNDASSNGGAIACLSSSPVIKNNIAVSNSSGIYNTGTGTPTLSYNDVWGNTDYEYSPGLDPGTGAISADPSFVSTSASDYHLKGDSPCIDNGASTGAPSVDKDGRARPYDGNGNGTPVCDIGAYEYGPWTTGLRAVVPDATKVALGPIPVSAVLPGSIYVETTDRSFGMRVDTTQTPAQDSMVHVYGTMSTTAGERHIDADTGWPILASGTHATIPLAMTTRAVCGGGSGLQAGIDGSFDLNNIGLLLATWGRVTEVDPMGAWFVVQEGCDYATPVRVSLPSGATMPQLGNYLVVTGASSCDMNGTTLVALLRPRAHADIQWRASLDPCPESRMMEGGPSEPVLGQVENALSQPDGTLVTLNAVVIASQTTGYFAVKDPMGSPATLLVEKQSTVQNSWLVDVSGRMTTLTSGERAITQANVLLYVDSEGRPIPPIPPGADWPWKLPIQ